MQLDSFGGQFACSRADADLEIIVSGVGGGEDLSLTDITYFLQSLPIDHSKETKISKKGRGLSFRRCVGRGKGNTYN